MVDYSNVSQYSVPAVGLDEGVEPLLGQKDLVLRQPSQLLDLWDEDDIMVS